MRYTTHPPYAEFVPTTREVSHRALHRMWVCTAARPAGDVRPLDRPPVRGRRSRRRRTGLGCPIILKVLVPCPDTAHFVASPHGLLTITVRYGNHSITPEPPQMLAVGNHSSRLSSTCRFTIAMDTNRPAQGGFSRDLDLYQYRMYSGFTYDGIKLTTAPVPRSLITTHRTRHRLEIILSFETVGDGTYGSSSDGLLLVADDVWHSNVCGVDVIQRFTTLPQ